MPLNNLNGIINTVIKEVSLLNAWENVHKFYQNDRRFSCDEMLKTPAEITRQLKTMGLNPKIIKLKCDGVTNYLDCIMPRCWDIFDAGLTMVSPSREVIADYSKCRLMVANRCKETKKSGIRAELVRYEDLDKINARGKFVLAFQFPGTAKIKAIEKNAAALVSAYSEAKGTIPDGVFWANGWTQSSGWYHSKEEPRLTTFMISHNRGKELERLLKAGKKVVLEGFVDSRTYDGELETVTAVLPGKSKKEFLLLGHMYEPFPSDNGDGCAAMLEIIRSLKFLVDTGKIPRPERSLRVMFSHEKHGAGQYFTSKKRSENIFAMLNIDSISTSSEFSGNPIGVQISEVALPFFSDISVCKNALEYLKLPFNIYRGTCSDDMFMADPEIGIPSSWMVSGSGLKHHNSVINFSSSSLDVYSKMLNTICAYTAEMLYLTNTRASREAKKYEKALKFISDRDFLSLKKRSSLLSNSEVKEQAQFITRLNIKRLQSLHKLGIGKKIIKRLSKMILAYDNKSTRKVISGSKKTAFFRPELEGLNQIIPARLTRGMPFSLAKIPFEKRRRNPLQSDAFTNDTDRMLCWIDGKRDLKQIVELFEMDVERILTKEELKKYLDYLAYLAKWGYLRLSRHVK